MRGLAYAIAAIAAVGIMIAIASYPGSSNDNESNPAANASTTTSPVELMSSSGTLTLTVPTMHCEFSCFPRVKETLEGTTGVESVALAEQKEEGVIDNRQVVVNYLAGFDINAALASLEKEGFSDSGVVQ